MNTPTGRKYTAARLADGAWPNGVAEARWPRRGRRISHNFPKVPSAENRFRDNPRWDIQLMLCSRRGRELSADALACTGADGVSDAVYRVRPRADVAPGTSTTGQAEHDRRGGLDGDV